MAWFKRTDKGIKTSTAEKKDAPDGLIAILKVPDAVSLLVICHLILSDEPEAKAPVESKGPKLFIRAPSEIVFNTKEADVVAFTIADPFGDEPEVKAGSNVPLTTLDTNSDWPPLLK